MRREAAHALRADARCRLVRIAKLRAGRRTLRTRRDLLVSAGWLTLLLACLDYDLGDARRADRGEIVAWSFELDAWFALTRGQLGSAAAMAASKAFARMGDERGVHRALASDARRACPAGPAGQPFSSSIRRSGTSTPWTVSGSCATTGARPEHARAVLHPERNPMRAAEARLTLAVIAVRSGDLDATAVRVLEPVPARARSSFVSLP